MGGWTGLGSNNIDLDPLFIDADGLDNIPGNEDDDLHLQVASPCIDAGDSTALPFDVVADLDGNPRILDAPGTPDTGVPGPTLAVVDMGVYEHPGDTIPIDAVWGNPDGGLYCELTNWIPGAPGIQNDAVFNLPNTYTVTFDGNVENQQLFMSAGVVTFDLGGFQYTLNQTLETSVIIGDGDGDDASLTILNGSLAADTGIIGRGVNTIGQVTVSGLAADWIMQSNLVVGRNGNGILNILNGSLVQCLDATIGLEASSSGTVLVSGANSELLVPFFLIVDQGTVTAENGGLVTTGFGTFLFRDGALNGDGTLVSDVINFGTVDPTGILSVTGDYEQVGQVPGFGDNSGTLHMALGGPTPGVDHDQLAVSGTATLGGGLFVNFQNAFVPTAGQSFNIINAPNSLGTFDVALMPGFPDNRFMRVNYDVPSTLKRTSLAGNVSLSVDTLGNILGFDDPTAFDVTGIPTSAAAGDIDDDGDLDIIVTLPGATVNDVGSFLILLNNGTDVLGWNGFDDLGAIQIPVGREPSSVVVGFFDAGSTLDLAITNTSTDNNVAIFLNNGDLTFNRTDVAVGTTPSDIAVGDFDTANGNGPDLVVTNAGSNTISILTNDGSGGFTLTNTEAVGTEPSAVAVGDFDLDGALDVAVANKGSSELSISFGLNSGFFILPIFYPVDEKPIDIDPADIDNDKDLDIIIVNRDGGTVSILINETARVFKPAVNLPIGNLPRSVVSVDMDNDGDQDLAVVVNDIDGDAVVKILRNDTIVDTVVLSDGGTLAKGEDPLFVLSGDVDNDLTNDLITINQSVAPPAAGSTPEKRSAAGPTMSSVAARLNASGTFCPSDTNGDGTVNVFDLLSLLAAWGSCDSPCPHDTNFDGTVTVLDLLAMLAAWGACP